MESGTKVLLAQSLEELLVQENLRRIGVSRLCEYCGISRKSFYYHFRDKEDLINWIFLRDLRALGLELEQDSDGEVLWENLERMCICFRQKQGFYRKVLPMKEPNAPQEYLRQYLWPEVQAYLSCKVGAQIDPICVDFFAEGVVSTIQRWLTDRNGVSPQRFVSVMKGLTDTAAAYILEQME